MKFYLLVLFIFTKFIYSNINFLDQIAVIVDEGIIMESEVNIALENTIKNFQDNDEMLPPKEILFDRVLEKLIMDEILLQKAEKFGIRISDQELNESLGRFAEQDGLSLQDFRKKIESEVSILENDSFKDYHKDRLRLFFELKGLGSLGRPKESYLRRRSL